MSHEVTETQLQAAQQSVEKYLEVYKDQVDLSKIKKIQKAEGENVLPKNRFRKALRT